jgi:hypothetical protein
VSGRGVGWMRCAPPFTGSGGASASRARPGGVRRFGSRCRSA